MDSPKKPLVAGFLAACLAAAGWALYLVPVHHKVVAGLETGACAPGQGCDAVLQSEWSELLGVPVSVPAVPLYLFLALAAVLALRGKLAWERVSGLAVLSGLGGLAFGAWLLFHMLYHVDSVCRLCLTMDAANLLVLALGAALHPAGIAAPIRGLLATCKQFARPGLEMALPLVLLLGTGLVQFATRPTEGGGPGEGAAGGKPEVVAEAASPADSAAASTLGAASSDVTTPRAPGEVGRPPEAGTRRVVLPEERFDFPADSSVPVRGPKNAKVTLVLFGDFQCPFCKKLTDNVEVLREEMGEKFKVAFMHFPMQKACSAAPLQKDMHNFACGAAAASVCAQQQGKFWELHDVLFRNNSRLRPGNLADYAEELGLDGDAWKKCLKDPQTLEKVKKDSGVGAAAGVTGTPALFVNGRKLAGAQPVAALRAVIEAELAGKSERQLLDVATGAEEEGEVPAGTKAAVTLSGRSGSFSIDAFEASIEGGKATSRPGVAPARGVTWYEAKSACEAAGKRLCTEEEWLQSCTGAIPEDENGDGVFSNDTLRGRQHAYGEHWREGRCASDRQKDDPRPLLTGNHPNCRTPEGVYDLEGVTKEWVGLLPNRASIKGGSYYSGNAARCAFHKDGESPDTRDDSIGFRCCAGGDAEALAASRAASSGKFPGGKVGDAITDWSAPRVDGAGGWGTKQLRGKPFLMTFWASWCEPCKKELPALAEIYKTYRDKGLEIVGVNTDESKEAALAYLQQKPLPFPVVLDGSKAVMGKFETRGVPTTFWVGRDGTIRQRTVGYDESGKARFIKDVEELLGR
jgi:protein-disulfide isomerase/peroxiredoxin/uncharacterized membrane protein